MDQSNQDQSDVTDRSINRPNGTPSSSKRDEAHVFFRRRHPRFRCTSGWKALSLTSNFSKIPRNFPCGPGVAFDEHPYRCAEAALSRRHRLVTTYCCCTYLVSSFVSLNGMASRLIAVPESVCCRGHHLHLVHALEVSLAGADVLLVHLLREIEHVR